MNTIRRGMRFLRRIRSAGFNLNQHTAQHTVEKNGVLCYFAHYFQISQEFYEMY